MNSLTTDNLKQFYGEDINFNQLQLERYKQAAALLKSNYKVKDPHYFRAPGRVNLIGEHTDYNGYPVMPMAINRDTLIAVKPRTDNLVRIANTDLDFRDREFSIQESIEHYPTGDWGNYVKAAVVGLLPIVKERTEKVVGFDAAVSGTVPPAGGLSSSSALVVASALVFLWANNVELSKIELAEILAKAERYVGTEGGGMDQAISLMGEYRNALKIDFFPLRAKPATISPDYKIVICNSLMLAPKTEAAMNNYNRRPVECRIAAGLIRKELEKAIGFSADVQRLADVAIDKTGLSENEYDAIIAKALNLPIISLLEIRSRLELNESEFEEKYLRLKSGKLFAPPAEGFKVKARYNHVITETNRVEEAAKVLAENDMERFGVLMNESHASCRDVYEISIKELDELTEIARNNGAIGSRLTGAGFGGCVVSLVPSNKVDNFKLGVIRDYFNDYLKSEHPEIEIPQDNLDAIIFDSSAVAGAGPVY
jgi:N-acetylgalactosamine kinase